MSSIIFGSSINKIPIIIVIGILFYIFNCVSRCVFSRWHGEFS